MRTIIQILGVLLVVFGSSEAARGGITPVTNEDIRDAILQVVNVVRVIEDKLERHEYRERVLGENLKKGLISIDKRMKLLEPFKGTINHLDQRLAVVETILMQKDERERIQLQKTFDTVEDIQKNLPRIVDKLKSDIIDKLSELKAATPAKTEPTTPTISPKDLEKLQKDIENRIDKVGDNIKNLENDLGQIKEENKNIKEITNRSTENLDKVKRQLSTSEQLLEKYENKLAEYNNRIPEIPDIYKDQNDWHTSFLQALDLHKNTVDQLITDVKSLATRVDELPEKADLAVAQNSTLELLDIIRDENAQQFVKTTKIFDAKTKDLRDDITKQQHDFVKATNEISENMEGLTDKFSSSYEGIRQEIENLAKVEQVMIQTGDSVLDIKRRLEYAVHQIIAEMQQVSKAINKEINDAISERFDTFEMSILDEETGALANLTSKIGQEMDQVWRQIGIMHQQMSLSTDTLTKLENQTDSYISGSLNVMDNMKGKVGTITNRIAEVDDNLNYLMGKLSLVTQEFNQIKSGLGKALDEMRGTYNTVKDKLQGPGPHKIEDEEAAPPSVK